LFCLNSKLLLFIYYAFVFLFFVFADDELFNVSNLFKSTMPWIGDDMSMKDPQAFPGMSLAQWMNIQQNPTLASSLQQNHVPSMSGSVLHNLPGADIAHQLGFSTQQISQSNNVAFNAPGILQTPQQLDHLQKLSSTSSGFGTVMQPEQQHSRQNLVNQTLPQSQVQTHVLNPQGLVQTNNIVQSQQQSAQNHQLQRSLSQNPLHQQLQQTIIGQNQQQNMIRSAIPDHINQQIPMSDNQIRIQLLQKLQQQQQTFFAQQSALQQPAQLIQNQEQQRQLLDATHNSRALTPNQVFEIPPTLQNSLPGTNSMIHQMTDHSSQNNVQFSHPSKQPKLQHQPQQMQPDLVSKMSSHVGLPPATTTNHLSASGCSTRTVATGTGPSVVIDDVPSCSTSPSTNNCANVLPPMTTSHGLMSTIGDDAAQSSATILSQSALETMSSSANVVKYVPPKYEAKPSLNHNQGNFYPQTCLNGGAVQTDCLDTSSSTTSVGLSQNDTRFHQNDNLLSYNPQSMFCRDNIQNVEVQADARCNIAYGNSMNEQMRMPPNLDSTVTKGTTRPGKDLSNNFSSSGLLGDYENNNDAQPELSSSMVSQTFGVPDMTFNSIDSTINDSSFLNSGPWAPPPPPHQFQRIRTYTKVYYYYYCRCFNNRHISVMDMQFLISMSVCSYFDVKLVFCIF
jgi:hypothetical protein